MYIDPVTTYNQIANWIKLLVNVEITPKNFVRRLGKHLNSNHTVRVRLVEASDEFLDADDFTIGAEYDPELDQLNKKQIIINVFINHPKNYPWMITQELGQRFTIELVEVLVHEYQHLHQYRSRRFKLQKEHFVSEHKDVSIKNEQEYLGNPDEIDAYASNIAARLYLLQSKLNTVVSKKNWTKHSLDLNNYTRAFGAQHKVVKTLRNKIQDNLQFLEDIEHGKTRRKNFPRPRRG